MGEWSQDGSWSNYNQQDWNAGQADGFQQFDYGNYNDNSGYTQDASVGYVDQTSYTGSMFIPDSTASFTASAATTSAFDEEPPLLEELGINPDHILQKTLTVLNPLRATDQAAAGDSDLAGPLCFILAFGSFLMLSGKLHFNYIYGIGLLGCLAIYALLNLMAVSGVAICTVVSVLGYCLIPIVGLSGLSVLFSLTGVLGTILTGIAVLWCTASSSKLFVTALEMRDQQLLVAYPCGLLYSVFALITMF
ncbi:protein YIPF5 [Eurytemora carolleeae]|uniref:protein YIPF5 n=1 Tax=Eurytemora carolleeae TaxID=1294199 RepID=UPI000C75CFFF|nr:protein YIPF5 [Eurytemora carolleeae]|eukprot:XP_023344658.1 protein YIPF5-like [Eurytemora affinis]